MPAGRRGPLASRGPYARAYRAYRLMRPCFPVIIVVVHVATGLVNKDGVEPGGTGVMPPLQCCTTSSTDSPTVRAVDSKRKCADTIMTQCRPKNMDFFELLHTFSRTLSSARLCGQPPSSGIRIVLLDITGGAGNISHRRTDRARRSQ